MIETIEERSKFERLYAEYRDLMYFVAFEVLNDEKAAEDAVQEAFTYVAGNMDKFGEAEHGKTKFQLATIVELEARKLLPH